MRRAKLNKFFEIRFGSRYIGFKMLFCASIRTLGLMCFSSLLTLWMYNRIILLLFNVGVSQPS